MNVARHLVQGVDVWLNNPRRPQEASGTSGEKALLNGGLNFSILDGWWAEAYDGTNGFAIGIGQTHAVPSVQDERDHKSLIETLTEQVVPLYYDRDASGLPRELDRPAEERVPDPGLAVQRRPDGDGLRPAQLPSRGRRRVVRDAPGLTHRSAVGTDRRSGVARRMTMSRAISSDRALGRPRRCSRAVRQVLVTTMSQGFIGEKLGSFRLEEIARLRRDGRGLPGHPRDDRPAGGRQDRPQRARPEGQGLRAVRARGRDPQAVPPPQHRPLAGLGPVQGDVVLRHGVRRGRDPRTGPPGARASSPGARSSTWAIQLCDALHYAHEHERRPPRSQAVEPDGHRRRPAQADRLRDRQGPGRDRS